MNRSTPGLPVHHQLPEFTQTLSHRVSDAIQPSHPLSPLLLLSPIPPSIRVFSNESTLRMRWPKYWSFSFSIIPSKEHPGVISFRMDWLDLLAVQGTLKSLPQHHSPKEKWARDYHSPVQFSSVPQSCPTLRDPMNHSTPGLPVHHQLPEFTQTHVHRVRGAIQPSHPLSSPSPPAPNPSQHQSLFQWSCMDVRVGL